MKLWLDDERNPRDPFIQSEFGSFGDEIWVKSANTAINYLKSGCITDISLDHDLGARAGNGQIVADWIEANAFNGSLLKLNWSIHSLNPVGKKKIYQALRNADKYWSVK